MHGHTCDDAALCVDCPIPFSRVRVLTRRRHQVLDALSQAGISAPSRPLSANVSEHGSDAGSVRSAGSQGSQRSGE
jgi:hypothetical protein